MSRITGSWKRRLRPAVLNALYRFNGVPVPRDAIAVADYAAALHGHDTHYGTRDRSGVIGRVGLIVATGCPHGGRAGSRRQNTYQQLSTDPTQMCAT
jgi:hypothetical protein